MEAEEFLELVYGERRGWIDLPAKVGAYWVPYHSLWEGETTNVVTRRIDGCIKDGENLYFSVGMFRKRGRNEQDLMASRWLWADLDEVHPTEAAKVGLAPTIAWQSSRGRYQALWALDKAISPSTLDKLNQALSYYLGADRGGWDRTQVLRVPGTRNFKYAGSPIVEILWHHEDLSYDHRKVWATVKGSHRPLGTAGNGISDTDGRRLRKSLPARARALLRVPPDAVVEGERSSRLWELECLLAEAGWGEDAIYEVVAESAWNKWSSVRTGEERLRREVRKALTHVRRRDGRGMGTSADSKERDRTEAGGGSDSGDVDESESGGEAPTASPFVRYASFMAMGMEAPRWMIENIWTQASHGIIGGEPKTSKSTLALAAAMSVASGADFLGRWPVHVQGPVLLVQEENAPWMMQDRMRKIARSYGLISGREAHVSRAERGSLAAASVTLEFPKEIPLRLLNNYGFDLADEEHRDLLEREVGDVRPVLVILDPLYLMFGGADYDKARDLYPFLKWLLNLRYEYDTAIMLVHHFRKQTQHGPVVRPGQRILGSTTFHGWAESAMYCSALGEGSGEAVRVKVEREFRNVAPQQPWEIELRMGQPGDLRFDASLREWNVGGQLEAIVAQQPGVTVKQAAEILGVDVRTLLTRARGSESIAVKSVKKGRSVSHQLHLSGADESAPDA